MDPLAERRAEVTQVDDGNARPLNLIRVMPAKGKRDEMSSSKSHGSNGNGAGGNGKRALPTITTDPVEGLAPLDELPASERAYLTDGDLRVPVRRITVDGGAEPPLDVYDTSGPRTVDLLPGACRSSQQPWIDRRVARRPCVELQPDALRALWRDHRRDALRRRCARTSRPSSVRDEVARSRAIIPWNIKGIQEAEPMIIEAELPREDQPPTSATRP